MYESQPTPWTETSFTKHAFQIVLAATLLVRLLALAVAKGPLASDAQSYCEMSRQLLTRHPFLPYWPPGVPLFLMPFMAMGANDHVLRASILIFWLIACWGLYRLMKALGVAGLAWIVLLVFSLLPDSIQMAIEPMTQMPTAALLILALSSAVRILRGAPLREYLLLGVTLGCISLIRPSALPLMILIPLGCAFVARRLYPALTSIVVAAVLVAGWVGYAHAMSGQWVINTANAYNMYYGNNPWTPVYRTWYFGSHAKLGSSEIDAFPEYKQSLERIDALPESERSAAFERLTVASIREHPGTFLYRTASRIRCFFAFDTFTSAAVANVVWHRVRMLPLVLGAEALTYLLLAGISIYWIALSSFSFWKDPANLLLAATMLIYAAPYWISMSHPTYHFPVLLPFAVLGANAWRVAASEKRPKLRGWLCVAALLLVQLEWIWQLAGEHAKSVTS